MVVGSFVVAVLALVVAVAGTVLSWRKASEANTASLRAAIATERQAELLTAEATKYRVPWLLEHENKASTYRLRNAGDEDAFDVHVTGSAPNVRLVHAPDGIQISGRSAVAFGVGLGFGDGPPELIVTWRRTPDGPTMPAWRHSVL